MTKTTIINKISLPRISFLLIGLAIGMSCITLTWFTVTTVTLIHRIKYVAPAILSAENLQSQILRLDEVLTMSARLYVESGDKRWQQRYDNYEPLLNQSIKQLDDITIHLNWHIEDGLAKKADVANLALVAMEREAFKLVQQGHLSAAKQLLFSPEYEKQKKIYFSNMTKIFNMLGQKAADELAKSHTDSYIKLVYTFAAAALLILIWTLFFRAYRRWKKALDSSIEANLKYEEDLSAAKALLEDKVQQRTAALLASNHQLTLSLHQVQDLQQAVIQSEKMVVIGQLAAGLAHEINNPLSFVMTNMNTLKSEVTLVTQLLTMHQNLMNEMKMEHNETVIRLYHQINQFNQDNQISALIDDFDSLISESMEGLTRIKRIVANLSDFSNIHQESTEPTNVNACIEAAIELVWNKLKYKSTLHKDLAELPLISASKHQLELVFMNLLINAVEAIAVEGEITVVSKVVHSTIVVTVSDNGCGIASEDLSRLFTPFFSKKTLGDSLHLGLSASYAIVQFHGGNIMVESSVGKGSTFTVTLPFSPTES